MLTWDGDGQIDMLRAAAHLQLRPAAVEDPGRGLGAQPVHGLGGMSGDAAALASFWPQFQQLLNDPDNFTIPTGHRPGRRARRSPPPNSSSSSSW